MAEKKFSFTFNAGEVVSSSVYKSRDGYSYAQVSIKRANNQYVSLGYEWQGDDVPDFAMDILGFMQMNKQAVASVTDDIKKEAAAFNKRMMVCLSR